MKSLLVAFFFSVTFSSQAQELVALSFEDSISVCSSSMDAESGGQGDLGITVSFTLEKYIPCVSDALMKANSNVEPQKLQPLLTNLLTEILSEKYAYATVMLNAGTSESRIDSSFGLSKKGQIQLVNKSAFFGQGSIVKMPLQRVIAFRVEL